MIPPKNFLLQSIRINTAFPSVFLPQKLRNPKISQLFRLLVVEILEVLITGIYGACISVCALHTKRNLNKHENRPLFSSAVSVPEPFLRYISGITIGGYDDIQLILYYANNPIFVGSRMMVLQLHRVI